jgi:hypothetical protein
MPKLKKILAFHNTSNSLSPPQIDEKVAYTSSAGVPNWTPSSSDTVYNCLIFYGSHGDSCTSGSTTPGAPKELNGLKVPQVKEVIAKLQAAQVSFRYIVLDCCMTSSFVPLFVPLLDPNTPNAAIISNLGPGAEMIARWFEDNPTLGDATAAFMQSTSSGAAEIMGLEASSVYCPVTIYRKDTKTMLQCLYANELEAFTNNMSNEAGDYPDVLAMKKYLTSNGITLAQMPPDQLQQYMRQNVTVAL